MMDENGFRNEGITGNEPTPPADMLSPTPPDGMSPPTPPTGMLSPTPPTGMLSPTPPTGMLSPTPPAGMLPPTPPAGMLSPTPPAGMSPFPKGASLPDFLVSGEAKPVSGDSAISAMPNEPEIQYELDNSAKVNSNKPKKIVQQDKNDELKMNVQEIMHSIRSKKPTMFFQFAKDKSKELTKLEMWCETSGLKTLKQQKIGGGEYLFVVTNESLINMELLNMLAKMIPSIMHDNFTGHTLSKDNNGVIERKKCTITVDEMRQALLRIDALDTSKIDIYLLAFASRWSERKIDIDTQNESVAIEYVKIKTKKNK